jgi:hypothetical protein
MSENEKPLNSEDRDLKLKTTRHDCMVTAALFALVPILISTQPIVLQNVRNPLDRMNFLVGHWTGEGSGTPGNGAGEFSFEWDLKRSILIRRSFAEYPATKDRPASRHDDFMVVFIEANAVKADYFDTEDHIIHYVVSISLDGQSVEFLSEPLSGAPRYRLTYLKSGGTDSLRLKFEIANPDKPNVFTPYIDATLHRQR